jgi:hypothetical protein
VAKGCGRSIFVISLGREAIRPYIDITNTEYYAKTSVQFLNIAAGILDRDRTCLKLKANA